jgi:hypothetical protein
MTLDTINKIWCDAAAFLKAAARNGERSGPMLLAISSLIFGDDGWRFAETGEAIVQSDICDPAAAADVRSKAAVVRYDAERIVAGSEVEVASLRLDRPIVGQGEF